MSHLPGNPHAKAALEGSADFGEHTIAHEGLTDATIIWQGLADHTQATLALAFEQRTANLIAWQALGIQLDETSEPTPEAEDDIAARLGLGENNE